MLFHDPDGPAADWRATEPLSHDAAGVGTTFTRSRWWDGGPSVWASVAFHGPAMPSYPGHVTFRRGADYLVLDRNAKTKNQTYYGPNSRSANANRVVLDDNGAGAMSYRWSVGAFSRWGVPGVRVVSRVEHADYTYVLGDTTACWSKNTGDGGACVSDRRAFVFLRSIDTLVLFDAVDLKDAAFSARWQAHHLAAPTVTGPGRWEVAVGGSRLFAELLSPHPVTLSHDQQDSGTWRVSALPTTPTANVRYTAVLQATATGGTPLAVAPISGGVQVGNVQVVFSGDGVTVTEV
jgi:hypothetical protein